MTKGRIFGDPRARTAKVLLIFAITAVLSSFTTGRAGDEDILRATLKNGLRVIIVRNTLAPVVTTEINYLAGSNDSPPGFPGTAHAQEHMMFRGSPELSADQLSTIMAAMGGNFNADTQQTATQYFFTVPADDLDIALRIESIRMRQVSDAPELWDKERGAIEQEVAQDLSNPEYVFYTHLLEQLFGGTPYALDSLGTRPSFDSTTSAMLKEFHDKWYVPNNAILVIVGDVSPGRTLEEVQKLFESIPSRTLPPRAEIQLQPLKAGSIVLDTDLPYGLSVTAYRLPGYDSPDYAAGEVLADVLDSQRGNLYALVPEGKALYTTFCNTILPRAGLGYAMVVFPKGGNGGALVSTVKQIIADYTKSGFPADLVEAAKRHEIASAEFGKNSISGLASEWSNALALEGRNSPDEDIEAIKRVSAEDVDRVARRYLINDTATEAVLTPRPSGKPVSMRPRRGNESFGPEMAEAVTLPSWAQKLEAVPPLPNSTVAPTTIFLPNGLRVIIQPESISRTVSIFGRVKNNPDLQAPKGQDGVASILDDLFPYGTQTLDRLAFQRELDSIGADESAGVDFSLQVLTEHFDRGVQLLAENLLHPALPASAFKVVRKETASSLEGELQSPSYLSRRALRTSLYPKDDPSLRQATPASVGSITLSNVRRYYGRVFRPDMTTIVLVGQVTPERAKAVIGKYFGEWQAAGAKPQTQFPPVPLSKPSSHAAPDASRVQVEVTLAETLNLTRSNPDYYSLQVASHVLAGAFYATRLYRDLRERAGLVYTVEDMLQVGKTRSLYAVVYACDPQNVSKARAIIEGDLRDMQIKPVTPHELQQAKTLLIHQIPLSESSVGSVGETLLDLAIDDLPLDEPIRAGRVYLKITAQQVEDAFAKWIRPQDFVQVTRGPMPE